MFVAVCLMFVFFFFKQKTAYEMRISDWSSDVCSSDLRPDEAAHAADSSVAKAEIAGPSRQTPAVDPVAVEPPGPLPSLENLTAESDLTAFLREGVPEDRKSTRLNSSH